MVPDEIGTGGPLWDEEGPQLSAPEDQTGVTGPGATRKGAQARPLTARERKRRWWLLALLLLLLALLAYATYYFIQNRRLPLAGLQEPDIVDPPRYLYSITGTGSNELISPVGVAVASDGRVFVVDFGRRRISVFTNNGRFIKAFNKLSSGEVLGNPVHLWIHKDELWVTDRRLKTIEIFNLDGEHLRTFEPDEQYPNWGPLALALTPAGELRVTDVGDSLNHRLHYFTADGSRTVTVGRTYQANSLEDEPAGFLFPNGVAISSDGRVFISDGNNRRLQVFDDKGEFYGWVDTSGVPRGIAIDTEDRLYVVDALAHTVDVYSFEGDRGERLGERLTQFGGHGMGEGLFNYPNDVTTDRRNRIYVTDRENDQVQVWGWPTAEPPAIVPPSSPWGWLWCLLPLLLLPLLFLRKRRIIVTPDFIEALITAEEIAAVAKKKRLVLVAPVEDADHYKGRVVEDVSLENLIVLEEHSEADARAMAQKYAMTERESILLSMAERAHAVGTQDVELRRLAIHADVRAIDAEEFIQQFIRNSK